MPTFAILRTQKLKSAVSVHRSLKHAFREQDTPNADPQRSPDNTHMGANSVAGGMAAFRARLPEKHRKDAVLAIEYLITASPEAMQSRDRGAQDAYFRDALEWLREKHGGVNVVYAGIHRDETTPHMYAFVVPRVGEKLNCRAFLGGSKALADMQTDFAKRVGKKHGLERGLEGSKARHTSIGQYYGRVNGKTPQIAPMGLPDPSLSERFNPRAYGERVANMAFDLVKPELTVLRAKGRELDATRAADVVSRAGVKAHGARLQSFEDLLRPLSKEERQRVLRMAQLEGGKIQAAKAAAIEAGLRERMANRAMAKGRGR